MTMDTAGKAVLFSGLTVLISLTAVMLVPSPAFRSMALGIMLAVIFVLAATLTLLPAVLGQARPAGRQALAAVGALRRAPLAALRRLGRAAVAPPARLRRASRSPSSSRSRCPVFGLKTGMPSIKVVPSGDSSRVGYDAGPAGLRPGRARRRCRSSPRSATPRRWPALAKADPGDRAGHARPAGRAAGWRWSRSMPDDRPVVARPSATTVDRLRAALPPGTLVGGAVAENHDLEQALLRQDAARHRRRPRPRLPAAAGRAAGADHRRGRRAHEPAGHRRGVRRRAADLPGRPPRRAARLRVAGLPRRLGARVLLRDDLRDLDGLHGVPAQLGQGALGPHPRPQRGDGRRRRALRPRDLRRGRP